MKSNIFKFAVMHGKYLPCIIVLFIALLVVSCNPSTKQLPYYLNQTLIYPDYSDVVLPPNIVPIKFRVNKTDAQKVKAVFQYLENQFSVESQNKDVELNDKQWKQLCEEPGEVHVDLFEWKDNQWSKYSDFQFKVASDLINTHISYRLIAPGYELWSKMGLYQRDLTSYDEKPIYENTYNEDKCVNCHMPNQADNKAFVFHVRSKDGGTFIYQNGALSKVNGAVMDKQRKAFVHSAWHPSGRYIAFSMNNTKQIIHSSSTNRVEVTDLESDIVFYDVAKNETLCFDALASDKAFETFPCFSPDGKTLYFATAPAVSFPDSIDKIRYSICAVDIDFKEGKLVGNIDTLYNALEMGKSASMPRISPSGAILAYTVADYGNLMIWHREADLELYDLKQQRLLDVKKLNSEDTESYHSWSSNGRWLMFSSRRFDGLYTRPFIAYVSENGEVGKPFPLPQEDLTHYHNFEMSYSLPEFMNGFTPNVQAKVNDLIH